uniref:V-type proton ATPase subunit e (inferred by orthology to a C. elegans protein) n=1 Tax=Strongyloides venezuelensis TaxID=75913 RepID=A0A0K0FXU8_STRVS
MAVWMTLVSVSTFWLVIGFFGPLLIPNSPNKDLIRTMIILTAICCWMFWIVVYLHQLNPLIGPQIPVKTIKWISKQWGDAKLLVSK